MTYELKDNWLIGEDGSKYKCSQELLDYLGDRKEISNEDFEVRWLCDAEERCSAQCDYCKMHFPDKVAYPKHVENDEVIAEIMKRIQEIPRANRTIEKLMNILLDYNLSKK